VSTPAYRSPARGFKRIPAQLGATSEVDAYNLILLSLRPHPAMCMRDLLIDILKKRQAKDALTVALNWLSIILESLPDEDSARFYVGKFEQWASAALDEEA
jgi:hypothetical protein